MILDNNVRFFSANSDKLIVWFGGINEPFLSDKLSLETTFDQLSCIDNRFNWYTAGILQGDNSVDDGVFFLRRFLEKYKKVVFCGQSSGGYAALLYGYYLSVDLCLLFSPQTKNFFNGQNVMVPTTELIDVSELYANGGRTRLIFNLSRSEKDHEDVFFWDDWRQVEKFMLLNQAVFIRHPYDNHSVSVKIRENADLYRYVHGLLVSFL